MQVIGAIGYVDKYDFVIDLAKTLRLSGKSVIVIDGTSDRKYRYVIPSLTFGDKYYITQYDGIDFAIGFDSMHDLENYTSEQKINISLYDYMILDIDNPKSYEFFRTRGIDKTYFFVDTSVISFAKNADILKAMKVYNTSSDSLVMTKILFRAYLTRAEDQYFYKKMQEFDVKFNPTEYEIPNDDQDKMASIDAQISGIIDLRKHTRIYIETIADIAAEILGDVSSRDVYKSIKRRKF